MNFDEWSYNGLISDRINPKQAEYNSGLWEAHVGVVNHMMGVKEVR